MCSACCVMCCILVIICVVRLLYIYFGFYSKYVLSASTESCKHRWKSSDLATHWGGQTIHGAFLAHALRLVVVSSTVYILVVLAAATGQIVLCLP